MLATPDAQTIRAVAERGAGDAEALARETPADVVLMDISMPVLDGLETPVTESDTLVILPAMAGGA